MKDPAGTPRTWSEELDERLRRARHRYVERRPRSAALADDADRVLPGGHTRTVLHFDPFPFRVASADGPRLTDVDGHAYLDLLGNYTAGFLGHSPTAVKAAIVGALDRGWSLGATHPDEIRFAQLIVDRFPSIELVRFTNSGTEANLMALAAAIHHHRGNETDREARDAVLVFDGGYHGGVLTFGENRAVNVPHRFVTAPYNDTDTTLEILRGHREIAAVLLEPMLGSGGCLPASRSFLEALRTQCSQDGTILVFDEVMTSRLSPGGAQALFDVLPDLTTLGKYLAGGMSFGAFGGRADLMAYYDHRAPRALGHAGTFNNNVVTMAAGVATLSEVLTEERLLATNARGDRLRRDLRERFSGSGLPMTATGLGSLIGLHPVAGDVGTPGDLAGADDRWRELFFLDALEAGFYFARRGFMALSLEVTDSDLEEFTAFVDDWTASI